MDQDLGTSLIMVNSEKGKQYYESINENIVSKQFTLKDAEPGNSALYFSSEVGDENLRKAFYKDLESYPFDVIISKYFPMPTLKSKIKNHLRKVKKGLDFAMEVLLSPSSTKQIVKKFFPTHSPLYQKAKRILQALKRIF
jgi:hypothetical protein